MVPQTSITDDQLKAIRRCQDGLRGVFEEIAADATAYEVCDAAAKASRYMCNGLIRVEAMVDFQAPHQIVVWADIVDPPIGHFRRHDNCWMFFPNGAFQ